MSEPDDQLMQRCRDGDAQAFEQLVRRWESRLARVLARWLGSAEVDDLCQEVFLRIYRARGRYRPRARFSTWLYGIALNVARDAARRRRLRFVPLEDQHPVAPDTGPVEWAQQQELGQRVEQALAALPTAEREALVLKHFGQLSFTEMAELTGLPASTLKSRVHAALDRLRSELKRMGVGESELKK